MSNPVSAADAPLESTRRGRRRGPRCAGRCFFPRWPHEHPCSGADCAHESHAAGEPRWAFTKGLHDLGGGAFAYLPPDGGWGWSNAGFVRDGEASLLVDTLFDAHLTGEMLGVIQDATGIGAADIQV